MFEGGGAADEEAVSDKASGSNDTSEIMKNVQVLKLKFYPFLVLWFNALTR